MSRRTLILPIGAGVIGQDDVPLVRIMDSDETPTTITVYGVVDTVQPVTGVTWTVNGVEQSGDVSRSPVLELTDLQPETNYAITLRATNINGESSASARTITTKKITTVTPNAVLDGVSYYNLDVYYTGNIPTKDENDIVVNGRDVTVPTGYYAESETVSVSSDYIIPTGTKNITDNGNEDVTQYASVNVNVQPNLDTLNVTPSTSSQTLSPTGGIDGWDEVNVGPVGASIDQNIQAGNIKKDVTILGVTGTYDTQPNMTSINVVPTKQSQVITPTGGVDGFDEVNVYPVTALIDSNITPENIKKDVAILGVTGTFEGGIQPTGTLNIVNNGTYDITNYASVNVNVAAGDFNEVCFTAQEANSTVYLQNINNNRPLLYYSTDNKQTWTQWDYTTITLANIGDKVYFYGYNPDGFSKNDNYNRSVFRASGSLVLSGNIMTLITRYGDREKLPDNSDFSELFSSCTALTDAENFILPVTDLSNIIGQHDGTGAYESMFGSCTNLTKPPQILATKLGGRSFKQMFDRCTSLTTAPDIIATTFGNYSCTNMFNNCTSLTIAPEIHATTLGNYCCSYMFNGCTSLTTAPSILPATTLTEYCYRNMFSECTHLTTTPVLPATTLAQYCYASMFYKCSSLTTTPELPATILESNCYSSMFSNCTSLTTANLIKGRLLDKADCYNSMFYRCYALNNVTILAETWNTTYASNWMLDVSSGGTLYKQANLTTIPIDSTSGVPVGWTVVDIPYITANLNTISFTIPTGWSVYYTTDGTTPTTLSNLYTQPIDCTQIGDAFTLNYMYTDGNVTISGLFYDYFNMFYIEALEDNTVLNLTNLKPQYSWNPVKVQYSTDKDVWTDIGNNMASYTLANTGDRVFLRKKTVDGDTWNSGNILTSSGTIKACGCVEYAVYWDITGNRPASGGCGNMFQNCTGLVDASNLKLFGSSYSNMFNGCTALTSAPALPATTLTNNSYQYMFQGCTSLATAPILPATTLAQYCYHSMFKNCTSLVNAPDLPATTLSYACYMYMFQGCTSLVNTPAILPATVYTGSCYASMFEGCTSIVVAPVINIASIQAQYITTPFSRMFYGCTSLQHIEVKTTAWTATNAGDWVKNVSPTGTFIKPSELVIGSENGQIPASSPHGIPAGWTVDDGTTEPRLHVYGGPIYRFVLTGDWPNDGVTRTVGDIEVYDGNDEYTGSDITITVRNGVIDYDDDDWNRNYGQRYILTNTSRQLVIETELDTHGWYTSFDRTYDNCTDWQTQGYSDISECLCDKNLIGCTIDQDMLHFTAQQPNSKISLTIPSGVNLTLYKSTDGVHFDSWDGTEITLYNVGDTLWVYGNNQTLATDHNSFTNFVMTGQIAASGDVTYLLQNGGLSTLTSSYALCGLFENCTSLTTAPSLPSTTLSFHCYSYMFYGCSGLTTAPSLPATTLTNGCYYSMFERCSNLTTAPSLPATTCANSCYYSMFSQCTSLTTAPALPATTLAQECYMGMFGGCSSLVNAPSLPATTLANGCYFSMFHYCTSLTTAPDLMAQTLDINCYCQMFDGCTNLNSVTCMATNISAGSCTLNWLRDVAATGTFTKNPQMSSWTTDTNGIPTGWTVVDAQ